MHGQQGQAGKINHEHTAVIGQAARRDAAAVDFSAPPAHREPQTQPGSIGAPLFERLEQVIDAAGRKATALVLHFDDHTVRRRAAAQRHGGPGPGELEGVLQQVGHDRGQYRAVGVDE